MTINRSYKITRCAALIEIDGEALLIKLSSKRWQQILADVKDDNGGDLHVSKVPNQSIFDAISENREGRS
ncbi:hypothetical protein LWC05_16400 [Acetobacter sicerae]|uniref:AbrB/MazE/SpoVT family DNA-binding domain-containing protein n=1 Tax=Acetobacter sicerae TaxID=85325 RepID=A0ABS8VYR3_9PROT|nr:hypothetical protein [Acetobacter sicerae]MCE0745454.1 hypothetical protein [Acetobacter sicerae]